jgi:rhodanese-related sulfurtransferase
MAVDPSQTPETIGLADLQALIDQGGGQLVDVRLPFDYFGGRIPGSLNLPGSSVAGHIGPMPADRTLVLICDDGRKSAEAAAVARAAGFADVRVLEGGYDGWLDADLPVETISDGVAPKAAATKA